VAVVRPVTVGVANVPAGCPTAHDVACTPVAAVDPRGGVRPPAGDEPQRVGRGNAHRGASSLAVVRQVAGGDLEEARLVGALADVACDPRVRGEEPEHDGRGRSVAPRKGHVDVAPCPQAPHVSGFRQGNGQRWQQKQVARDMALHQEFADGRHEAEVAVDLVLRNIAMGNKVSVTKYKEAINNLMAHTLCSAEVTSPRPADGAKVAPLASFRKKGSPKHVPQSSCEPWSSGGWSDSMLAAEYRDRRRCRGRMAASPSRRRAHKHASHAADQLVCPPPLRTRSSMKRSAPKYIVSTTEAGPRLSPPPTGWKIPGYTQCSALKWRWPISRSSLTLSLRRVDAGCVPLSPLVFSGPSSVETAVTSNCASKKGAGYSSVRPEVRPTTGSAAPGMRATAAANAAASSRSAVCSFSVYTDGLHLSFAH